MFSVCVSTPGYLCVIVFERDEMSLLSFSVVLSSIGLWMFVFVDVYIYVFS